MKRFGYLIFVIFSTFLWPQQKAVGNIDSLTIQLEITDDLKQKHAISLVLADSFSISNPDLSLVYARESYKYAQKLQTDMELWQSAYKIADLFFYRDSLRPALKFAQIALSTVKKNGNHKDLALSYNQIGLFLTNLYDYETAGEYLFKSLAIFEKIDNKLDLSNVLNSIGYLYYDLGNFEKARTYYTQSLDYALQVNDDKSLAKAFNNLAVVYETEGKYDQAEEYFKKALKINESFGKEREQAINLMNLGIIQKSKNKPAESLAYFHKSKKLAELTDDKEGIAYCYIHLSKAFENLHNPDSSFYYANAAYNFSKSNKLILVEKNASSRLQSFYNFVGNADSANLYELNYYRIQDSLNSKEQLSKVSNMELKYEFKKQQQILELQQQRSDFIKIIFIGSLIFIIIIIILLYARLRIRNKNQFLLKQQLEKDVEIKNKELTTGVMYSIEKNKVLSALTTKLVEIERNAVKEETKEAIRQIAKKIQESLDANAWEEFEARFNQVHNEFYETLTRLYPELTPNEKRLCAFLRLDMSSKEISRITGQSLNAIEMARIRLRKKLGISHTETNLITFLSQY